MEWTQYISANMPRAVHLSQHNLKRAGPPGYAQSITSIQYTDNIMLTSKDEQELTDLIKMGIIKGWERTL